jgi:hypothetical protein
MSNALELLWAPATGGAKYFILIQLKRIFCPPGSSRRTVWWVITVLTCITVIYFTVCFIVWMFACMPREKIWNPDVPGKCISEGTNIFAAGPINLVIDLGILFTPLWAIWHLQMPLKRKLGVSCVFAVGIL